MLNRYGRKLKNIREVSMLTKRLQGSSRIQIGYNTLNQSIIATEIWGVALVDLKKINQHIVEIGVTDRGMTMQEISDLINDKLSQKQKSINELDSAKDWLEDIIYSQLDKNLTFSKLLSSKGFWNMGAKIFKKDVYDLLKKIQNCTSDDEMINILRGENNENRKN